ncbi:MarR family winged helix-turn-helix transcriptional regulator [Novosphingobium album (ex Hu et al. 2023)]|uniref:MarR family winged helix-turn-helix transcriptional regulator n=1 Tax=Novosphingobium album (ex Hu et al. 2023) TaxID=2930093 RepID=A0ABT0B649_9SPHN|nr:MarR family winged helix-turn-helix transcriptional regulator [Novosphingobium album (ex Hu et al. 2023)]MCJ2180546.1 MarR family winged helix-turn-helix transcriptional regulator [Novosphingobium album (ex Hu et al. 2023)]
MNRKMPAEELHTDLPKKLAEIDPSITTEYLENITLNKERNIKKIARKIYNIRQKRGIFFRKNLFGDPAWDIILDLYIAEEDEKEISITSACVAAGVPTSTGLRWITILIQNGYVDRHDDPADARRSYLRLTATARDSLEALLSQFSED